MFTPPPAVDPKGSNRRQKGEAAQEASLVSCQLVKAAGEQHLQADKNHQRLGARKFKTVKASKPFPRIPVVRIPVQNALLISTNPTMIEKVSATPILLKSKPERSSDLTLKE